MCECRIAIVHVHTAACAGPDTPDKYLHMGLRGNFLKTQVPRRFLQHTRLPRPVLRCAVVYIPPIRRKKKTTDGGGGGGKVRGRERVLGGWANLRRTENTPIGKSNRPDAVGNSREKRKCRRSVVMVMRTTYRMRPTARAFIFSPGFVIGASEESASRVSRAEMRIGLRPVARVKVRSRATDVRTGCG